MFKIESDLKTSACINVPESRRPIIRPNNLDGKTPIWSVRSNSCIMIYDQLGCNGYSRKIIPRDSSNPEQPIPSWRLNLVNIKPYMLSFQACNLTEGGSSVNVDVYDKQKLAGKLLKSLKDVCDCTAMPAPQSGYLSIQNHGNCIEIFEKEQCTGFSLKIDPGRNVLSDYLSIPTTVEKNEEPSNWKDKVMSFRPCEIPKHCVQKLKKDK